MIKNLNYWNDVTKTAIEVSGIIDVDIQTGKDNGDLWFGRVYDDASGEQDRERIKDIADRVERNFRNKFGKNFRCVGKYVLIGADLAGGNEKVNGVDGMSLGERLVIQWNIE